LLRRSNRVPMEMRQRRLEICAQCPVYHAETGQCGKPGRTWKRDGQSEQMGCMCFMKLKAWGRVNCWLWDTIGENPYGWPKELNNYDSRD
jgi:hypothetical protein